VSATIARAAAARSPKTPRVWQRMLSGRRLDLADPSPLDIEIGDIAHGLARVARWNGQTLGPEIFSVAQHSLLVEAIAEDLEGVLTPEARLALLLHDAAEYVIGDLISPFKALVGPRYRETERRLSAAIAQRFGIAQPLAPGLTRRIKRADRAAAHLEAGTLAGFSATEARRLFGPAPATSATTRALLAPLPPLMAEARYLARILPLIQGR